MTVLLAGLLAFTLNTVIRNRSAANDIQRAVEVGGLYGEVSNQISLSAMLMANYQVSGDPQDLSMFAASVSKAYEYGAEIREKGTDEDIAAVDTLSEKYAAALVRVQNRLLEAAAGGEDLDPLSTATISEAASDMAVLAQEKRQAALARAAALDESLRSQTVVAILAFVLGVPLIAALYFVTRHYELKSMTDELHMDLLQQAALTDGLTGLANHRAFQEDLRREVARAARLRTNLTVAMIDVDDFKELNDSRGHAEGDQALIQLAEMMSTLRAPDRAFRVGGDELALILPDTSESGAMEAMQRLSASLAKSLDGVTISIGISTAEDGQQGADVLRDRADAALYEAKHRGKNQVVSYQPELEFGTEMSATKMQALRRVLQSGEIAMWLQPIFNVGSRKLIAFEALLRLPQDPALSGPADAFAVARHMGHTRELDMLCITNALDRAKDLPAGSSLFVNIDPGTLFNIDFSVRDLLDLATRQEIEPRRLVFEITEITALPTARLVEKVEALRSCGFGIALDGVGSGNVGLEMMRLLRVDYVKIDRSVVLDAVQGGSGRAIISAVAAFARESNTFMIVEGVETSGMLESIKFNDDEFTDFGAQSYLFGEPSESITDVTQQWPNLLEGRVA